jgi:hypothetical protein
MFPSLETSIRENRLRVANGNVLAAAGDNQSLSSPERACFFAAELSSRFVNLTRSMSGARSDLAENPWR